MPEGDGEEPHQDRLGGHEQGNVRVSEHEISWGREGVQHRTQARLIQRNVTSGRSQSRHLGDSVKQPEGNSVKSVLLCEGEAQSLHRASGGRRRRTGQSAVRAAEKELVCHQ